MRAFLVRGQSGLSERWSVSHVAETPFGAVGGSMAIIRQASDLEVLASSS
jgi:hypothetical protein